MMNARICATFVVILTCAAPALAQTPKQAPAPAGNLFQFQGTPEEQAACAPDSNRFCKDDIPDTFKVLACLQEHREKLRKACQKVLEDHGQ